MSNPNFVFKDINYGFNRGADKDILTETEKEYFQAVDNDDDDKMDITWKKLEKEKPWEQKKEWNLSKDKYINNNQLSVILPFFLAKSKTSQTYCKLFTIINDDFNKKINKQITKKEYGDDQKVEQYKQYKDVMRTLKDLRENYQVKDNGDDFKKIDEYIKNQN